MLENILQTKLFVKIHARARRCPEHSICEWKCSDMYSATCTYIYIPYVLWLKDQATRKGAVPVPTLRRLWTVSDSFKLR